VGLEKYKSTWTSSTEALAFWREEQRAKIERQAGMAPVYPVDAVAGFTDAGGVECPDAFDASTGAHEAENGKARSRGDSRQVSPRVWENFSRGYAHR
jgi:hypothetical protein